jgi:hypothetical protein
MCSAFCVDATDLGKKCGDSGRGPQRLSRIPASLVARMLTMLFCHIFPIRVSCSFPVEVGSSALLRPCQIPREVVDICVRPRRFCTRRFGGGACELSGFPFVNCRFCFHSRYYFEATKRLLASSINLGSGAWVRSEMRAMRTERSRLMFEAGINGRFETDDASAEQKISQLARRYLKMGRTSVLDMLVVSANGGLEV